MRDKQDPLSDLEAELGRLQPRRPTPDLSQRIGATLDAGLAPLGRVGRMRYYWVPLAVACSLLIGLSVWLVRHGGLKSPEQHPPAALAAGWRIEPTGAAQFQVLAPDCIRLDRGELLVESVALAPEGKRPPLVVQTPAGKATAVGTRFYIGTHLLEGIERPSLKGPDMANLTRVLVLAGVVTLANAQGSITGEANHLLAAETGRPPTNCAVQANSDFAMDLYRQLAKENTGKNLFFSPYSVSSALAMAAEGARDETAEQMGKALRFPEVARHIGEDAQLIPWNTAMIHTDMAALNDRYSPKPIPPALRDKIATLRKALAEANRKAEELEKEKKYEASVAEAMKSQELAKELNGLFAQVDQYEIRVANALWGEKSYPFQGSYLDTIHKFYHTGGIFPVDFKGDPEGQRLKINAWVEEQTQQHISKYSTKD